MANTQAYNFTLDDTSPVILYAPYSDGDYTFGWQQWYSGNGFNTATGEDGIGDSFHISSFPGASIELTFFGVGVELRGTTNRTIEVQVDGSVSAIGSPPSGVLFSVNDLNPGSHTVQLALAQGSSDGLVQFDSAIVQSLPPNGSQGSPSSLRIDNQNNSIISYAPGVWTTANAHQVPSPQNPAPFVRTNSRGAWASMNFTGKAIAINGMINYGHWTYQVVLDNMTYTGFNASTFWIAPDATLFYQDGLDESIPHKINITNTVGSMDLTLNSFTVFGFSSPAAGIPSDTVTSSSPLSSSPSSSTQASNTPEHHHNGLSTGAIVGIVLALVLLVAAFVGALLLYRRRKRNTEKLNNGPHSGEFLQVPSAINLVATQFAAGTSRGELHHEADFHSLTAGSSALGSESAILLHNTSSPSVSSLASPSFAPALVDQKAGPTITSPAILPGDGSNGTVASPYRSRLEVEDDATMNRIAALVSERIAQHLRPQESDGRLTPPPEYHSMPM